MGVMGLIALGVLSTQGALLTSRRGHGAHARSVRGAFALFMQSAIALCFCYFVAQTMAAVGLQTFLPAALNAGFAVPLGLATTAVTAYLLGGTAGIALGGYFATLTTRHDRGAPAGPPPGASVPTPGGPGLAPPPMILPRVVGVRFAV